MQYDKGNYKTCKVARAALHHFEEPCISGTRGSGTIFFSGCILRCAFCQNYPISRGGAGKIITSQELAAVIKKLEEQGAHNINFVTPSHVTPAIIEALNIYRPSVPIIYNTSGYDSIDNLEVLKNYIDVFLPDFKYYSPEPAKRYSSKADYPETARKAILYMRELQPENITENGIIKKGVIIRHLVLPGNTGDSIDVLKWIKENIKDPVVSLMSQYLPINTEKFPEINRKLKPVEYKKVVSYMEKAAISGYIQEPESANERYIPEWDLSGV